jgi:hypothetical protein
MLLHIHTYIGKERLYFVSSKTSVAVDKKVVAIKNGFSVELFAVNFADSLCFFLFFKKLSRQGIGW